MAEMHELYHELYLSSLALCLSLLHQEAVSLLPVLRQWEEIVDCLLLFTVRCDHSPFPKLQNADKASGMYGKQLHWHQTVLTKRVVSTVFACFIFYAAK